MLKAISIAFVAAALVACGPAASGGADAQPAASAELSAADRTAILTVMTTPADAQGMVQNECGEKVAPRFLPIELGGAAGTATLLVMEGGPNTVSCYGDGPGLTLLVRDGASWRFVYDSRGGYLAVLPSVTRGVRDLAFAGPGFEHPLWTWNGTEYTPANRMIADAQMENATILP